jgi:antitoxin MazE
MMVKTLRPMGNSYGIIIDRPIMALLGIEPDTQLELTTQDGALLLRPMKLPLDHKTRVREAARQMAIVHREALRELAD